jgi:hypothetical protein
LGIELIYFGYLGRALSAAYLKFWRNRLQRAAEEKTAKLRQQRREALALQRELGDVLPRINDELHHRLHRSKAYRHGSNMLWAWRPELWAVPSPSAAGPVPQSGAHLASNTKVFFDDADCAVIIQQFRNDMSEAFAPYGVALELFQFEGSFLSLAIDLPDELYETFAKDELIGLSGAIVAERPTGFTVRLNIKHGPNTEQLIQAHDLRNSEFGLEFDPEHLKINVNRVEKIWLDLVFETPNFNRISLIDLAFSKRPRVEI